MTMMSIHKPSKQGRSVWCSQGTSVKTMVTRPLTAIITSVEEEYSKSLSHSVSFKSKWKIYKQQLRIAEIQQIWSSKSRRTPFSSTMFHHVPPCSTSNKYYLPLLRFMCSQLSILEWKRQIVSNSTILFEIFQLQFPNCQIEAPVFAKPIHKH